MRLLVERGMEPDDALLRIRMVRPGAVETDPQRSWAADVHTEISRDTSKIDWNDVHSLLHGAFAYMEDRIAPPSSLLRMSPEDLKAKAETGFFWSAGRGARLAGCLFGSTQGNALYLGKLAVRSELRGRGIARALIEAAQDVGRLQGQTRLRLDSRVELTETHKAFKMLGFEETGRTAHPGFERPTSIVFERPI
jgi:GNAT superfamily N-acetyltransferase